jgi:hypothetical protein
MQTTQVRRPLPVLHVHDVLPPGAVRRSLHALPPRAGQGATRAGAARPAAGQGAARAGAAGQGAARAEAAGQGAARAGTTRSAAGRGAAQAGGGGPAAHGPTRAGRRGVSLAAAVAAGTAVLVAVALGLAGAGGGGDGDRTPDTRAVPAPPAPPMITVHSTGDRAGSGPITVAVPLPPGLARARVNALADGPAPEADVTRLAAALGLDARPEHTATGWTVRSPGATLQVADDAGRRWTLRTAAAEPPLPGRTADVPIATPGGAVPDAARAVLAALGLDRAEVRYAAAGGALDVVAAPLVGDLSTAGLETRLRYADRARLTGGAGWLAPPVLGGPTYPLVSAQEAVPTTAPGRGVPREIVAARPGLSLRRDLTDRELLVPAWFYALRGGSTLIALAVDPAYVSETP